MFTRFVQNTVFGMCFRIFVVVLSFVVDGDDDDDSPEAASRESQRINCNSLISRNELKAFKSVQFVRKWQKININSSKQKVTKSCANLYANALVNAPLNSATLGSRCKVPHAATASKESFPVNSEVHDKKSSNREHMQGVHCALHIKSQ